MTLKKIFFLAVAFLISFPNFGQERMNKLINEKSLYLKQHSSNPVDWMPWGYDALTLAKSEKKLMIISIGYSSCHWWCPTPTACTDPSLSCWTSQCRF